MADELHGALQEVFGDLKRKWKEFQDQEPFYDVFMGFIHAIDWTEPWIISILVFHVVLLLAAVFTRKSSVPQGAIFIIAMGVVYNAELLNQLGRAHWERFSRQNYFDQTGVFMSAVVSGPLLLVMLIVLVKYLIACSNMLVQAKVKEIKHKARLRAKAEKTAGAAAGGGGGAGGAAGGESKKAQ